MEHSTELNKSDQAAIFEEKATIMAVSNKNQEAFMINLRRIPLENAHNFRDLGGYPASDGKVTRWGILFRSDNLSNLSENDWETLKRLNIKLIIDLRSSSERSGSPIEAPSPIDYEPVSLMKEIDTMGSASDAASITSQFMKSMVLDYSRSLFGNITGMVKILGLISDELATGKGSVVFLCSAGKDRTGMTAALLLYLCGVSREDIIADYMVSSTYNANGINKIIASMLPDMAKMMPSPDKMQDLLSSKPETIEALLDSFEEKDIRKCLAENGFDEEKQAALVRLITE